MRISSSTKEIFWIGVGYITVISALCVLSYGIAWCNAGYYKPQFWKFIFGMAGYGRGGAYGTLASATLWLGGAWLIYLLCSLYKDLKCSR